MMSIDEHEARREAAEEAARKQEVYSAARDTLGVTGDAIDVRVESCLVEAEQLLAAHHPGPALSLAATAGELIVRFLLVRPLVQGAFHSDDWASILADRIGTGRTSEDRILLPDILRQYGIEISTCRTESGILVWEFMRNTIWPQRDYFVHRGDRPTNETATRAIEVIRFFRNVVVDRIASQLGFTLTTTGKWCEIMKNTGSGGQHVQRFEPWDPITGTPFKP
jgi:hypothetical protein